MGTTIIGIDCATKTNKIGIARGHLRDQKAEKVELEAVCCFHKEEIVWESDILIGILKTWITESQDQRCLIAIDAPLGWPEKLGEMITVHKAGGLPNEEAEKLFLRNTDRLIGKELHLNPLEVGADKIGRTAHAALNLLFRLRKETGLPIPLAWKDSAAVRVSAIEVYPAATLKSYGWPHSGYKDSNRTDLRREIVCNLGKCIALGDHSESLIGNDHLLDATICLLAGLDFLDNSVSLHEPVNRDLAEKEGWIWVCKKPEMP